MRYIFLLVFGGLEFFLFVVLVGFDFFFDFVDGGRFSVWDGGLLLVFGFGDFVEVGREFGLVEVGLDLVLEFMG